MSLTTHQGVLAVFSTLVDLMRLATTTIPMMAMMTMTVIKNDADNNTFVLSPSNDVVFVHHSWAVELVGRDWPDFVSPPTNFYNWDCADKHDFCPLTTPICIMMKRIITLTKLHQKLPTYVLFEASVSLRLMLHPELDYSRQKLST